MMKEVTVRELVETFGDCLVNVESPEHFAISIDMCKARIDSYDEDSDEIAFTAGNYNVDGIASIIINVKDSVDCIEMDDDDENDPAFYIRLNGYMPDIVITKFKTIEEIK